MAIGGTQPRQPVIYIQQRNQSHYEMPSTIYKRIQGSSSWLDPDGKFEVPFNCGVVHACSTLLLDFWQSLLISDGTRPVSPPVITSVRVKEIMDKG